MLFVAATATMSQPPGGAMWTPSGSRASTVWPELLVSYALYCPAAFENNAQVGKNSTPGWRAACAL